MKKKPDFSDGVRGAVLGSKNKTRVTMYIDNDVLEAFRDMAEDQGRGYQTLINQTLRESLTSARPVDAKSIRKIIREELRRTGS